MNAIWRNEGMPPNLQATASPAIRSLRQRTSTQPRKDSTPNSPGRRNNDAERKAYACIAASPGTMPTSAIKHQSHQRKPLLAPQQKMSSHQKSSRKLSEK